MAWVTQSFQSGNTEVHLFESSVTISDKPEWVDIHPKTREQAHDAALMLRRAARRLEEIGKDLP